MRFFPGLVLPAAVLSLTSAAHAQCERPPIDLAAGAIEAFEGRMFLGDAMGDGAVSGTGRVTVLEETPSGWTPAATIFAPDGRDGDRFGTDVAIVGDILFCGAPGRDGARGVVDVYERSGAGWVRAQRLRASNAALGDQFGYALDASVDVLVVGAPRIVLGDSDPDGGSAYVFERSPAGWTEVVHLNVSGDPANGFGIAVAAEEDTVVVGRAGFPIFSTSQDHDARVYERGPGGWSHVQTLTGSSPIYQSDDEFGWSIDIEGDRMAIGAMQDAGFAYIFERGPQGWFEVVELGGFIAGHAYLFLGQSLALSGDSVVVGAPSTFQNPGSRVFLFEKDAGGWHLERELVRSAPDAELLGFGRALELVDGEVWAPSADGGGRVYRFAEAAGVPYCTSGANTTGQAARISMEGTCASVTAGDLELRAGPVPNTTGLFLYGSQPLELPFGAGVRCVGGSVVRLPAQVALGNVLRFALDLNRLPAGAGITAGDTRYFQAWFRDAGAFDLSNGLRVTFGT